MVHLLYITVYRLLNYKCRGYQAAFLDKREGNSHAIKAGTNWCRKVCCVFFQIGFMESRKRGGHMQPFLSPLQPSGPAHPTILV